MIGRMMIVSALSICLVSCGDQDNASSTTKSIVDGQQYLFGVAKNPASGEMEFRLCRGTAIPASALNDTNVCINPYLTNDDQPLTVQVQTVADLASAKRYLRLKGYSKGAAGAVLGGVAGYGAGVMLIVGGGLPLSYSVAGWFSGVYSIGLTHLTMREAGGYDDREAARSVEAVLGDFYSAKTVSDTKMVVNKLAQAAEIKVNPAVAKF